MQRFSSRWSLLLVLLLVWQGLGGGEAVEAAQGPRFTVGANSWGVARFRPGRWGLCVALVRNPDAQARVFNVIISFDDQPRRQFARTVWVPAGAQRSLWIPVLPPDTLPPERAWPVTVMLLDGEDHELARDVASLIVERDENVWGLVTQGDLPPARSLALAVQSGMGHGERVLRISPGELPPMGLGLDALDGLVLAAPLTTLGPAQREAIRHWVMTGGHLWMMLDPVSPQDLTQLFPASGAVSVIDAQPRLHLNFHSDAGDARVILPTPAVVTRLLAPDWQAEQWVDGAPVAMTLAVGRGRVLLTTAQPHAWLGSTDHAAALLQPLVQGMKPSPPAEALSATSYQRQALDMVGPSVIGRGWIAGVLGLFCLSLLGGGLWLRRRGRLEAIAWLAPNAALATAVILLTLGMINRRSAPPTASMVGVTFFDPAQGLSWTSAAMAVYQPHGGRRRLATDRAALILPLGQPPQTLRMRWTDRQAWQWENLSAAGGAVERYALTDMQDWPVGMVATLGVDEGGAVVTLTGPGMNQLVRPLLATPTGRLSLAMAAPGSSGFSAAPDAPEGPDASPRDGVTPAQPGTVSPAPPSVVPWRGGVADLMADDAYLPGPSLALIGDRQRRREAMVRTLLTDPRLLQRPTLVALWPSYRPPADLGPVNMNSEMVVWIPLSIIKPPPGKTVTLPAPLWERFTGKAPSGHAGAHPTGQATALGAYNEALGQWMSMSRPGTITLQFQPLPDLGAMTISQAQVTVDIDALGRQVRVLDESGNVLAESLSPQKPLVASLKPAPGRAPAPATGSATGGTPGGSRTVTVRIEVSPMQDTSVPWTGGAAERLWQVRQVSVSGQALTGESP